MLYSKSCTQCDGLMIRYKKSEANRSNWLFCSQSCKTVALNKSKKITKEIELICLNCKKEFSNRQTKRLKSRKFCKVSCAVVFRNLNVTPEQKLIIASKISKSKTGKKLGKQSVEVRLNKSLRNKGDKSHLWKGGVTKENNLIRQSVELKLWREAVFKKDDYTCQDCKIRGGYLEAHHIKSFAYYPEFRTDINNGLTLCKLCHSKTDSYKKKKHYTVVCR